MLKPAVWKVKKNQDLWKSELFFIHYNIRELQSYEKLILMVWRLSILLSILLTQTASVDINALNRVFILEIIAAITI